MTTFGALLITILHENKKNRETWEKESLWGIAGRTVSGVLPQGKGAQSGIPLGIPVHRAAAYQGAAEGLPIPGDGL